ncbi:PspA/IM30 family protein [Helicosporidium sp. ATCC 50920]|nr:PspA/IM30 family protein [Helicosporidium sp. ATCC 50920]|eukprot:KDD73929.1 PspA/IM30 family protein [Helicosporidium sp. ATCC 50920]
MVRVLSISSCFAYVRGRTGPPRPSRGAAVRVHAGLFSRVSRIIRSYVGSLVSRAEDPEKLLETAVSDMQRDVVRLRQAAAEVTASQRRLQAKHASAESAAAEWKRRAELALARGEENLAREALARRRAHAGNAEMLGQQLQQQGRAVDTIVGNQRVLEAKLAEARLKKDTLKARAQSARSARAIQDMLAGLDASSSVGAFERMEDRVLSMEAEAEAATLLVAPDDLETRFRDLEGGTVDDDLEALRAELQGKRITDGRPLGDVIDLDMRHQR